MALQAGEAVGATARDRGALPAYFHSLDALRGIAALSVVFWHWQHFYPAGPGSGFDPTRQPLFRLFEPLYLGGSKAVTLFFGLSGFVFHWRYGREVGERRVSAWRFASLRLSRLYPLHLATLALVAVGQAAYSAAHGSYFVYPAGDPRDLALQLTLAPSWGAGSSYSFNGPIWSVSIEVLLYAIFFAACRAGRRRRWHLALLVLVGALIARGGGVPVNPMLGLGMVAFFSGGLAYHAVEALARLGLARAGSPAFFGALGVAWAATAAVRVRGVHWSICKRAFPGGRGGEIGDLVAGGLANFDALGSELVVFPLAIATLALAEARWGAIGKRLAVLGEVSYSSYLLHFPLQLAFVLAIPAASSGSSAYDSPWALAAFFAALFPLSVASYRWLERPAQSALRLALPGGRRSSGIDAHVAHGSLLRAK